MLFKRLPTLLLAINHMRGGTKLSSEGNFKQKRIYLGNRSSNKNRRYKSITGFSNRVALISSTGFFASNIAILRR
jgi:hypothetical protein